ncbi:MAG TPA: AraC family transcriptional regulator [Symbiobacteriaceae bacterium]|nr:AraC family transcriptional regulator [Symbiobacteriaceae bacterium]
MNPLKRMNDALDYIEAHLSDDVDLRTAAKIAGCSEYHFRRMFSSLAGIPISEYVRRRRLTLAAQELAGGSAKVIDVAVKYQYDSPDAFARAFQAQHGFAPSQARREGSLLNAFTRMTFQLSIKGGSSMNYRIVEKAPFRIVGLKRRVTLVYSGVNPEIAAMWASLDPERIRQLKELANVEPVGLVSASVNFSEGRLDGGTLDHYIGAATDKVCPAHFEALEVPALTWAVFESVGPFPETLQDIWGRIYAEWFPSSDYEQTPGPELLWNESKDVTSPTFRSEIWIPVKRRS